MDRVAETLYALARPKDHPLQTPLLRAALVRAGSSLAMAADYHRQLLEKAESRVLELNREGDES